MNKYIKRYFTTFLLLICIISNSFIFIFADNNTSSTDEKTISENQSDTDNKEFIYDKKSVNVKIHYHRFDQNYTNWEIKIWPDKEESETYSFNNQDNFGAIAEYKITNVRGVSQLGFRIQSNEGQINDIDIDRFMKLSKLNDEEILEVYIVEGFGEIKYSLEEVDLTTKILNASLENLNTINIDVNIPFELHNNATEGFSIKSTDNTEVTIKQIIPSTNTMTKKLTILLNQPLQLGKSYKISKEGYGEKKLYIGKVFNTDEFDKAYYYDGSDLGARYSKSKTSFRLWSPTATKANVLLYSNGKDGKPFKTIEMKQADKGTWVAVELSDLKNIFYTYQIELDDKQFEAVDPYAKSVGINGTRGMIVDLNDTNPVGFNDLKRPEFKTFTDAIIYETHIRDFTIAENSGIINKGKYLGFTESDTTNPANALTGLEHLKNLGITHVHLLPTFDYNSIDESDSESKEYNWGYDPLNYNVPEGSYSTNPSSGTARITEFKKMIYSLHSNNIRVIMDVVYNHTAQTADSNLNKLVPNYYYRQTSDGSFSNGSSCGNEIASERLMVRKMIVDSVVYWATEYKIDGFRFDLMGLHDVETMNEIRKALNKVDPTIIIYGEGWTADESPLPDEERATKNNISSIPNVAVFNDDLRDGIKGDVFTASESGFVNGTEGLEETIKFGVVAGTKHEQIDYSKVLYSDKYWANSPNQCINYVSSHDNLTLWDKLLATNPDLPISERIKMDKLSTAIVLTSQGIPFLLSGEEMLRTKQGNDNSYKSPDEINQIDWNLKSAYSDIYEYYKGLIEFRKAHPSLRMITTKEIQENLTFLEMPAKNMVGYSISNYANYDIAQSILVFFNANKEDIEVKLPKGTWKICINDEKAGTEVIEEVTKKAIVPSRSALVLVKGESKPFEPLTPLTIILIIISIITVVIGIAFYVVKKSRKMQAK